jgi:hypothetical protein
MAATRGGCNLFRIEKVDALAAGWNDWLIDNHFYAGFLELIGRLVEVFRADLQRQMGSSLVKATH